jgi:hypothetical protein
MTTITVIVDDERTDSLEQILREIPYVKDICVESNQPLNQLQPTAQYERIKKYWIMLDNAKGKELFKDIEDPAEWQREIRRDESQFQINSY